MPKRFGHTVCSLATILVALSFVGCRTTASKLASVPGLGWMERGEEGWAQYEPAPPRPSTDAEPTLQGNSAADIASNSDAAGSGTRSPFATKADSAIPTSTSVADGNQRFDASRYAPGKSPKFDNSSARSNSVSTFGDYASAYGKYGPPKSATGESKIAPQQGPYDTIAPKYAGSATSGSTGGYDAYAKSKFDSPATTPLGATTSKPSANGGLPSSRFDNTISSPNTPSDSAEMYTASSESRFGASASSANRSSTQSSTYTPPGFAKSSSSESNSRFGELSTSGRSAPQAASSYLNAARDQLSTAAENASTGAGQIVNQFADSAKQTGDRFVSNAQTQAEAASQNAAVQTQQTFNRYAQPTTQAARSFQDKATQPYNAAVETLDRFGGPIRDAARTTKQAADQVQGFARQENASFDQSAGSTYGQAKSSAVDYTNRLMGGDMKSETQAATNAVRNNETVNAMTETSKSYLNAAEESFGQARSAVQGYNRAAGDTGQNVMQNVSAPMQQQGYPSTSTPNPFVVPGSSIKSNQNPAPTSGFGPVPDTTSPSSTPSMQRSPTPYRPGSTSTYQGATTTRKPSIELTGNSSQLSEGHIALAVGDKYQFPRTLR